MAMEKLIEETKVTIQSLFIHTVLILTTLIGSIMYCVCD